MNVIHCFNLAALVWAKKFQPTRSDIAPFHPIPCRAPTLVRSLSLSLSPSLFSLSLCVSLSDCLSVSVSPTSLPPSKITRYPSDQGAGSRPSPPHPRRENPCPMPSPPTIPPNQTSVFDRRMTPRRQPRELLHNGRITRPPAALGPLRHILRAARPRLRRPQRRWALAPRLWRTTMTCTAPTRLGGSAPLGRTPPPSPQQRHQLRRPITPRSRVPRPTRTVQLIERVKAGWCLGP